MIFNLKTKKKIIHKRILKKINLKKNLKQTFF